MAFQQNQNFDPSNVGPKTRNLVLHLLHGAGLCTVRTHGEFAAVLLHVLGGLWFCIHLCGSGRGPEARGRARVRASPRDWRRQRDLFMVTGEVLLSMHPKIFRYFPDTTHGTAVYADQLGWF